MMEERDLNLKPILYEALAKTVMLLSFLRQNLTDVVGRGFSAACEAVPLAWSQTSFEAPNNLRQSSERIGSGTFTCHRSSCRKA